MKRTAILVTCLVGFAGVLAVGAVMAGVVPFLSNNDSGRPPCAQLPPKEEVTAALDRHADRVTHIQGLGDGISVQVATPCDDPDLALMTIRYRTDDERTEVHDFLNNNDGFGVPVQLIKER